MENCTIDVEEFNRMCHILGKPKSICIHASDVNTFFEEFGENFIPIEKYAELDMGTLGYLEDVEVCWSHNATRDKITFIGFPMEGTKMQKIVKAKTVKKLLCKMDVLMEDGYTVYHHNLEECEVEIRYAVMENKSSSKETTVYESEKVNKNYGPFGLYQDRETMDKEQLIKYMRKQLKVFV